jgi:hypothetical protein
MALAPTNVAATSMSRKAIRFTANLLVERKEWTGAGGSRRRMERRVLSQPRGGARMGGGA